jgi:methylenetetrahydrofolate reductase (NADPH)
MTRTYSFEFFPPKTPEGAEKLRVVRKTLAALKPKFFSVTFGAGGSTREGTLATVAEICAEGVEAAPHLSCVGSTRDNIRGLLNEYRALGVRRIVALRGDQPSGAGPSGYGEFRFANELVEFIRAEMGDALHIEVAAYPEFHPQAHTAQDDLVAYARKVKAGANSAITQFFFNADAYFRFVEETRKLGAEVPVVPGIMPITNYMQLKNFAEKSSIDMPRWIEQRLRGYGDDAASIRAFGLDVTVRMCEQLLAGGAPGLHFYSMNQAAASMEVWRALKLS